MHKDLTNKKFGRLTVLETCGKKRNNMLWLCKCDCGNETKVIGTYLINGNVKSCGCLFKEIQSKGNPKHNLYNTRIYKIWRGIKDRCYNEKHVAYKRYGGRGIKMCDDWKNDVVKFNEWAINNGYNDNLTIDRIDNNGDYEPNNCRWATKEEQQNNTRKNKFYEYNGELLTLSQISRKYNISDSTLYHRLKKYNSIKIAIELPINLSKKRYW